VLKVEGVSLRIGVSEHITHDMYYENCTRGTQRKVQKKNRAKNKKIKSKKVQLATNTCTSCQSSL